MNAPVTTDKMLSRKEGSVGYLTFNNPERHNAVSLDMWEAASGFLEDFKNDNNIRVVVVTGAGGKAFVSARTFRNSIKSARPRNRPIAITNRSITPTTPSTAFPSRPSP